MWEAAVFHSLYQGVQEWYCTLSLQLCSELNGRKDAVDVAMKLLYRFRID